MLIKLADWCTYLTLELVFDEGVLMNQWLGSCHSFFSTVIFTVGLSGIVLILPVSNAFADTCSDTCTVVSEPGPVIADENGQQVHCCCLGDSRPYTSQPVDQCENLE